MIFARANLVNVLNRFHCEREPCRRPRQSGGRGDAGGGGHQDHQQHVPLLSGDRQGTSLPSSTRVPRWQLQSVFASLVGIQSQCAVRRKACRDR